MIKTFFQKYIIEIIIIGILIAIGLHFWNPVKDIFNHPERSRRIEDTQEYKALEKDRNNWKDSAQYYKGLRDQLIMDYRDEINKLPAINTNYHKQIKQVKQMNSSQIEAEYQKYVQQQNDELKKDEQ